MGLDDVLICYVLILITAAILQWFAHHLYVLFEESDK